MDPRRGAPLIGSPASVTVVARNCAEADAWATALFALGCDAGLAVAEGQGLAAVFAVRGEGGARTLLSSAAQEMLG
jgi:thiamine biosynthesis lipoprotein